MSASSTVVIRRCDIDRSRLRWHAMLSGHRRQLPGTIQDARQGTRRPPRDVQDNQDGCRQIGR
jgi:hypothetical protein